MVSCWRLAGGDAYAYRDNKRCKYCPFSMAAKIPQEDNVVVWMLLKLELNLALALPQFLQYVEPIASLDWALEVIGRPEIAVDLWNGLGGSKGKRE
jgi:hypothetical protein